MKPPKPAKSVKAAKPGKPPKPSVQVAPLQRIADAIVGARLCYGEPVRAGERTVIPVSRLRVSGGGGWGRGGGGPDEGDGVGGGGGGHLDAQPVGFIDVGPEGTRYVEIPDPERLVRNVKGIAAAVSTLAAGAAGARRLTLGRKRPQARRIGR